MSDSIPSSTRETLSEDARSQILNAEVAKQASRGWNVQTVAAGQAVLSRNKRIGWFWNTILTILTGGLWLIVVIVRVVNRKKNTLVITVDAYGKVRTS
ncbi:hypothetical protein EV379_3104 [Microterricola gilva]|uniref:Uncharacterized protein n=1 Tax=Microterricola gilva TaxID=393267 RepID=A0A4Q8AQ59_9MICO|nr:hypothetical protein [Microterricola gilva]RZU66738.1 hypothetical protein EV379_3104 [Microterricola gilva]